MVLQLARRTASYVAIATGGLLPHLFTLTYKEAVILCYATVPLRTPSYSEVRCSALPRLSSSDL